MNRETPIHELDPRSKFWMIISYSVLAFIFQDIFLLAILGIFTLPLIIFAKAFKIVMEGIQGLSVIMIFILVVNSYFISFNFAIVIILRIIILITILSIFFQTTLPEDITQSLITMHFPYSIAFSLSLSFRFIPTMAKETNIVKDAQKSRGHRLEKGGLFTQIKNFFPILIPLLLNSIRRAFHVAEALETRGFGINKSPKFYRELKMQSRDWLFIVFNIIFLIGGILIRIYSEELPNFFHYNLPL